MNKFRESHAHPISRNIPRIDEVDIRQPRQTALSQVQTILHIRRDQHPQHILGEILQPDQALLICLQQ
jgi:hypothetical protein